MHLLLAAAELTLLPDSIIDHMHYFQRLTSMAALKQLWVDDFKHCVTQLSDVIGGGRDVPSGFTESLPQLVALSLANTLQYLLEEDVEMLTRFLPVLRNLDNI